jgi:hypothetical protein
MKPSPALGPMLVAVCLGATACGTSTAFITGSGRVVSRPISVASFSRLEAEGAFEVRLSVGAAARVTVRADDNVVPVLGVGVSGDALQLKLKSGISVSKATLRADVTVRTLAGIEARGASRIIVSGELRGASLSVRLAGASQLQGRMRITEGELDLEGASRVRLAGSTSNLTVKESGASGLEAEGLRIGALTIDLSGASTAEVTVTDSISAGLSGASSLRYRGSPRFSRSDVSGGSSITHL